MIVVQQSPEGPDLACHAVRGADHDHRVIQDLQGPFHLRGKIHMSRRIQDRIGPFFPINDGTESGLLGVNGDAVLPLHGVGIQKGIFIIDPSLPADGAAPVEKDL